MVAVNLLDWAEVEPSEPTNREQVLPTNRAGLHGVWESNPFQRASTDLGRFDSEVHDLEANFQVNFRNDSDPFGISLGLDTIFFPTESLYDLLSLYT